MGVAELEILLGGGGCRGLPSEGNKEYEIRTKMEEEQRLQLKMLFLLGYNVKIVIWCKCVCVCVYVCVFGHAGGGNHFWWRGEQFFGWW